jgi:hypothetical protein
MDIATQQDTPATQSRNCSVPGARPRGRADGRLAVAAGTDTVPVVIGSIVTGGRRRSSKANGTIDAKQNKPMPM